MKIVKNYRDLFRIIENYSEIVVPLLEFFMQNLV